MVVVDVVVDVPVPARRRAGTVVLLARTVVVAVTAVVLVDVTGRGLPVVIGTVVVAVTGCVLVDMKGRVRVEVVTGAVVVTGCVVVVITGAVPTPATGGRLNKFNTSSTLIR